MNSESLRNSLKQFDSGNPWKPKISKSKAILDREYVELSEEEIRTAVKAVRKDWAVYFGIPVAEIQSLFEDQSFDCDDFALLMQADMIKYFRKLNEKAGKAKPIFRCVIDTFTGPHAIVMAKANDWIFIEPQDGTLRSNNEQSYKILAVT
jgi:hypothetical protein